MLIQLSGFPKKYEYWFKILKIIFRCNRHQKYSKILVQVFFSCSCSIETYLARAFEFYKSQADKLLQEQQAKIKIPFDGCYK